MYCIFADLSSVWQKKLLIIMSQCEACINPIFTCWFLELFFRYTLHLIQHHPLRTTVFMNRCTEIISYKTQQKITLTTLTMVILSFYPRQQSTTLLLFHRYYVNE